MMEAAVLHQSDGKQTSISPQSLIRSTCLVLLFKYVECMLSVFIPGHEWTLYMLRHFVVGSVGQNGTLQDCMRTCLAALPSRLCSVRVCKAGAHLGLMRIVSLGLLKLCWDEDLDWFVIKPAGPARLVSFEYIMMYAHRLAAALPGHAAWTGRTSGTFLTAAASAAVHQSMSASALVTALSLVYTLMLWTAIHTLVRLLRAAL